MQHDEDGVVSRLDENGHEVLSTETPAIPLRFKRPTTEADRIRALVAGEMSRMAEAQGFESFEEANDFDIGDDYDPSSEHEIDDEQEHNYATDRDRFFSEKRNPSGIGSSASGASGSDQREQSAPEGDQGPSEKTPAPAGGKS